jgi:hypothetical protein
VEQRLPRQTCTGEDVKDMANFKITIKAFLDRYSGPKYIINIMKINDVNF